MADSSSRLRIGYVPEHYLLPLHLSTFPFPVELIPFPSGTGQMITSLRADDIDLAIGLTEGWVAGLLTRQGRNEKGYRIVGRWVQSPLRWAIVTGRDRDEIDSVADLQRHRRVAVSRLGSGSHIMAFVLAQQEGWTSPPSSTDTASQSVSDPLDIIPLGPLAALTTGVQAGGDGSSKKAAADFFMWEHFTTKPHFSTPDSPLKKIGEIYTPWPSWHMAASDKTFRDPQHDARLAQLFEALDSGIRRFHDDPDSSVGMLGTGEAGCQYGEDDAREWLKTARFVSETKGVDRQVMDRVVTVLQGAGVVEHETCITQGDGVIGIAIDSTAFALSGKP